MMCFIFLGRLELIISITLSTLVKLISYNPMLSIDSFQRFCVTRLSVFGMLFDVEFWFSLLYMVYFLSEFSNVFNSFAALHI